MDYLSLVVILLLILTLTFSHRTSSHIHTIHIPVHSLYSYTLASPSSPPPTCALVAFTRLCPLTS